LYAIRFFFNNWIYLSESYDIELLNQLEKKKEKDKYFITILLCSDFDIAMATLAGLGCGVVGHALFIKGIPIIIVYTALLIHYLSDVVIFGVNMLLRMREKPQDYDFNVSRVIWWITNNAFFCVVIIALMIFDVPDEKLWFLLFWMLNSFGAVVITLRFAFRENLGSRTDDLEDRRERSVMIVAEIEGQEARAIPEA
jgi:hypothetical protein